MHGSVLPFVRLAWSLRPTLQRGGFWCYDAFRIEDSQAELFPSRPLWPSSTSFALSRIDPNMERDFEAWKHVHRNNS